ncbi:MAG TPA: EAL domain-containing protein [Gammaproteobacteria bacterium]|nr:EAL domain-containing protein [Gammaproteobacteria bacterium]
MPVNQSSAFDNATRNALKESISTKNQAFNSFLDLSSSDQKILQRYHEILMQDGEIFAQVFYDYLQAAPSTSRLLKEYEAQGGQISDLIKKQLQHLFGFLSGHMDESSAERLAHIGEVHHRFGVDPVWIMGAYRLYLRHLQRVVRNNEKIADADRAVLEETIIKLLFRDMGLMLEAYWESSLIEIESEKEKVASLQEQINDMLTNIPQIIWSVDIVNGKPLYISPSSRQICDMDIDMPIPCLGWTVPEDRRQVEQAWQEALEGRSVEIESRVIQPDGKQFWFRRMFCPYKNSRGEVVRIDGMMEDTTEIKVTLEQLHTLATTDALTGLTNRTLFHDRLSQAIAAAEREGETQVVVMIMDLDHFKEINDTLGHPAGDSILLQITDRLQGVLRKTDTLARLGGDEFGILLPHVSDGFVSAEKLAEKLLEAFVRPYHYEDNELYLGASIGIAVYPEHGGDVATLMSRADVAMYHVKNKEEGFKFYHIKLNPDAQHRLQLSGDLRHALERNELVLHYQPKIDLVENRITGAEVLIRWDHPVHGLIPPDKFIPLAERSGFIRPLTDWILMTATQQCCEWRLAGYDLRVAVNVSARSFQTPHLVDTIASILGETEESACSLEIEITENVLMADITNISHMLQKLSDLGCQVAVDDFGTGYSSLAYLKKLPLNTLKIDKSFVLDMANDENDATIVRSTIDLAHNLGLKLVAEGVEDRETLSLLMKLGCDSAQGFFFSRPQPAEQFLHYVNTKFPEQEI